MKKLSILLILLLSLSACEKNRKCDTLHYTYSFPQQLQTDYPYIKLYRNDSDFYAGKNAISPNDSMNGLKAAVEADNQFIPIIDIRKSDGTNSWSNQSVLSQLTQSQVLFETCQVDVQFADADALIGAVSSSPTYLHLVLQDPKQDGGNKTWAIRYIYDEDSVDVTNRPEWLCIKNLTFAFYKGGKGAKIKISTSNGQKPCGAFGELFKGQTKAFATYSLEGELQDELRITAPAVSDALKEQLTFHVLSSAYNQLTINLTNNSGQIGYATLIPVSYE